MKSSKNRSAMRAKKNIEDVFAPRLRTLRKRRKLTQIELSQISGVSQGKLSKLENSVLHPTWNDILKLCLALKTKVTYFATKTV